ncbi:MAG: PDDEXK nuclease domain-containing protein [bacterium]|nr:PDDEXK nuclease domain-containing protein [bacterium]MDY4109176.1 PDDEXK nuclease domain-containing protein [Bacilli bacterium]
MNYYDEIKNELVNNEIYKRVKDYSKNKHDLSTYYNVGKLLSEAGKSYGDGIIKEYSKRLTNELGKKYSYTYLTRMRQFYLLGKKVAPLAQQLTWSHYVELISLKNIDEIRYYIDISASQNLSRNELRNRIKSKEYERLDNKTKEKLINKEDTLVSDFIKDPIIINNSLNHIEISERVLKELILNDLDIFLKQLGNGFCYIENEYKIKIGNTYNYIDILLFNYQFNCFVVVELKVTELRKEHIGQIEIYMNYIDKNIRRIGMSNTIGLIISKYKNEYIIEYSSDSRIKVTTYLIK